MSNTYDNINTDDTIQHGIDDSRTGDAEKGATLGGIGGAVTGAIAGAAAGPIGAVAGAIIGGVAGAVASGAAVAAVDRVDNDNTISGVGDGVTTDMDDYDNSVYDNSAGTTTYDNTAYTSPNYTTPSTVGNGMPGIQTGGHDIDGTPDTRGIGEKIADTVTGDNIDDKTGKPVARDTWRSDTNAVRNSWDNSATTVGNGVPGVQTGGWANDGTPDTRGVSEKVADAVTGDNVDDKTGKVVDHP